MKKLLLGLLCVATSLQAMEAPEEQESDLVAAICFELDPKEKIALDRIEDINSGHAAVVRDKEIDEKLGAYVTELKVDAEKERPFFRDITMGLETKSIGDNWWRCSIIRYVWHYNWTFEPVVESKTNELFSYERVRNILQQRMYIKKIARKKEAQK